MDLARTENHFLLGFDAYVADPAYEIIGCGFALVHGHDVDGIGLVVGAQNQLVSGGFHVFNSAGSVFKDGVHVELALSVGLEGVVVAVDEECGTGQETRVHAHAFAAVDFNDNEAFPMLPITFSFRLELFEKCFLELQNLLDVHAGD